jgi:hypothetical protein
MIWLTWRQLRIQTASVIAALLALAVALALTRSDVLHAYHADARTFLALFDASRTDRTLYLAGMAAVYAVPAVIGVFWGAPMVARELEAGTHRLIWTQSVTRNRWLATKLGTGLLAATGASALISLAVTWWCAPVDRAVNAGYGTGLANIPRIAPAIFAARGVAPIGYAAFAFVLGVTAGALLRRTVPAMAVTLVVYVLVQIAMPLWVRPHLVAPAQDLTPITRSNLNGFSGSGPNHIDALVVTFDKSGAWVLSSRTVDSSGQALDGLPGWVSGCLPRPGAGPQHVAPAISSCFDQVAAHHLRQRVTYQPAGHYWSLQWRETGLVLGVTALLTGACFWRVRRLS